MELKNQRLNSVDGIKGICACIVAFVWHYQHFTPGGSPFYHILKPFYEHGYLAVEIFFMFFGFGMLIGYDHKIISGLAVDNFWYNRVKKYFH